MRKHLTVWPESPCRIDDQWQFAVTLEYPDGARVPLWYRVSEEWKSDVTDSLDPFVRASVFVGMSRDWDFDVRGSVSKSFLRRLDEFQAVWSCWRPKSYRRINIRSDIEQTTESQPKTDAIACFSGGVDACFTAYRHVKNLCGRRNERLRAGLIVHGFDIPLQKTELFQRVAANAEQMLGSIGLPLIKIATNYRDLSTLWEDSYGTSAAGCLSLFQPRFGRGLIGSAEPYNNYYFFGTNPLTDSMLSSDSFAVIHDGAEYTRSEKVELIAQWPEAMKRLRVCWEKPGIDLNCSQCEKCIRTILNFRATGVTRPESFALDVTDSQIAAIAILGEVQAYELESLADIAVARGFSDEPWVRTLLHRLDRYRNPPLWEKLTQHVGRVRAQIGLRTRLRRMLGGGPSQVSLSARSNDAGQM